MEYKQPKEYIPPQASTTETVLVFVLGAIVAALVVLLLFTWNRTEPKDVMVEDQPTAEAIRIGDETLEDLTADAKARGQFHFVPDAAVASTTVAVAGCQPDPRVIEVALDGTVEFNNSGSEDVTITLNAQDYAIPAGEVYATSTNFGKGAASYGYSCSLTPGIVGVITVRE